MVVMEMMLTWLHMAINLWVKTFNYINVSTKHLHLFMYKSLFLHTLYLANPCKYKHIYVVITYTQNDIKRINNTYTHWPFPNRERHTEKLV